MSEAQADLVSSRDTAMRVSEVLLKKGAKNDAIEVLTVWASAKNDADGHKLLAEALRHGSDNPLAKAAFAQMEGIGDGAVLAPFRTKWTVETLARIETEAKKPSVGWAAEVGYNNNVEYRNLVFHIQTEDSGVKRPHIITHVFADGGRIIKSVKRSYAALIGTEGLSNQVCELMKGQHKEMCIALREGRLDDIIDGRAPGSMETLETPPITEARKKPPQPSHAGADSVPPHGLPTNPDELAAHPIIAGSGELSRFDPAFMKQVKAKGAVIRQASSSILNIAGAIKSGLGCGQLPCVLGELDPDLQLCFLFDEADFALLLMTREEMRNLPHVRAFNDFIASRTSALRHMIEGRAQIR